MKSLIASSIAAALFGLANVAGATTITFDSLEQAGVGFQYITSYQENGFQLDASDSFASARQGETGWYLGSAGLFDNYINGVTTLSRIDGNVFSLNSIDLGPVNVANYGTGAPVDFIGHVHGGGTVTQSVFVDSTGFQTFTLSGFTNLDSVTWAQVANYHQFDNIVVDAGTDLPEPASLALTGVALAALGASRRRRRV